MSLACLMAGTSMFGLSSKSHAEETALRSFATSAIFTGQVRTATEALGSTELQPSGVEPSQEVGVAELESRIGSVDEQLSAATALLEAMKRLKFSGYIQGRFEYHADSEEGLNTQGKPSNTTQFLLRRGRLKAVYAGSLAEFLLQIDATPKGVVLKDAEATFVEPWTGLDLRLTAGQFKWPFGYEILQSSSVREMPERSRVVRALFPGERDRGLRLQGSWNVVRFAFALVNGNGTEDATYGASDQNNYKDVVGRVGVDFDHIVVGVSGYWGKGLATTELVSTTSSVKNFSYASYRRARFGVDVQAYFDVPSVGGLALKGEFIGAKDRDDATALGFYVLGVQHFGEIFAAFARVDYFDPNHDKDSDSVTTLGGGLQAAASENLKATLAYEHPISAGVSDPSDDILTVQLQGMF